MDEQESLLGSSKRNPHLNNANLNTSPVLNWLKQLKILLTKNLLLIKGDWSWLIITSPVIILAILFILQEVLPGAPTHSDLNPKLEHLAILEDCKDEATRYDVSSCVTVGWATGPQSANMTMYVDVMDFFKSNTQVSVKQFPSEKELIQEKVDHPKRLKAGVIFNPENNTQSGVFVNYKILWDEEKVISTVQRPLDEALFAHVTGNSAFELPVFYRDFPSVFVNLNQPSSVTSSLGPLFFFLPPMILTFIALYKIVQEKEKQLRLGMNLMGLKDSAFWISWLVTIQAFNILLTLILIGFGAAFQFEVFLNTDFFVNFVVFFEFGTAMIALGFFLSTVLHKTTAASNAGWAILLVGFALQLIVFGNTVIVYAFYSDVWWLNMIRYFFQIFYPPFNFSKAYIDISQKTQRQYSPEQGKFISGQKFTWGDLYDKPESYILNNVDIPATDEVLWYLFAQIILYTVATWYFDNVVSSPNGPGKPLWFFLMPSYWGYYGSVQEEVSAAPQQDLDQDVIREAQRTIQAESSDPSIAMRILGLEKIYRHSPFFQSKRDLKAVGGLYLTINHGECFCFLGHNGAGKTTTINILNGLYEPSAGTAKVYGLDIRKDIVALRKVMGVCPQHDILWPELTARQHLRLFAEFKGLPRSEIEETVDRKLNEVGLFDVGNNPAKSFSGGMKRRLSVAIASIGDPKVIFLDEPTTGLDPLSKRAVWDLIQNLKKDRCIILTTHSLEEADILSDRIAIMSFGRFRCIGSSLHLKGRYGDGYRINLVVLPEDVHPLKQFVSQYLPNSELLSESAGNLTFKISLEHVSELSTLCQKIEEKQGPKITDWGISHTTLEDVFLRVTQESNFTYKPSYQQPPPLEIKQ